MKVDSVQAVQGPLYPVMGEDEELHVYDTSIIVLSSGKQFVSKTLSVPGFFRDNEGFAQPNRNAANQANALVEKVKARGFINPSLWEEFEGNLFKY